MSLPQIPERIKVTNESTKMLESVTRAPRNKVDHLESFIVGRMLVAL
jgi:cob(I)alamin adenosyltransferase